MTTRRRIHAMAAEWLGSGVRTVAATLVDVDGSAPFDAGATMLFDGAGRIEGSVTGGCVEGALFDEALEVLAGGGPRLRTYGVSDEQAAGVGLMCGGTVHVFVNELPAASTQMLQQVTQAIQADHAVAILTVVEGQGTGSTSALVDGQLVGTLGQGEGLDGAVARDARGAVEHGISMLRRYGTGGEIMGRDTAVFIDTFSTPGRLVIFGAIDHSIAVSAFARHLGYRVTICEARSAFAASAGLDVADEVVVAWPQDYLPNQRLGPRDVVLVFTHDPKFDEPALKGALETDAGYIGALGSRRTHRERVRRLLAAGVPRRAIERIAAPCGLDIGARTPEETAISILAEVIARATGRGGSPLSETSGPIRPRRLPAGDTSEPVDGSDHASFGSAGPRRAETA